jgi:hypothetical protein
MPCIDDWLDTDTDNQSLGALAVLQARNDSFRAAIRYRGLLYSSDACFTPIRDFARPIHFRSAFHRALAACARLLDVYPPFGLDVLQQRQQQLRILEATYSDSLKFRLKDSLSTLAGKFRSKSSKKKESSDPDAMAQRLWDDSMSCLAASIDDLSLRDQEEQEERSYHLQQEDIPRATNYFGGPIQKQPSSKDSKNNKKKVTESPLKSTC